jgi:heme/copper-type cytochrome/quinol oxidase subunit 1
VDDWLARQINLLDIPLQNWMVVTFALMLIAALINLGEHR